METSEKRATKQTMLATKEKGTSAQPKNEREKTYLHQQHTPPEKQLGGHQSMTPHTHPPVLLVEDRYHGHETCGALQREENSTRKYMSAILMHY